MISGYHGLETSNPYIPRRSSHHHHPPSVAQRRFNRSPWKSRGAHSRFTATSLRAVPSFSLDLMSQGRKKTSPDLRNLIGLVGKLPIKHRFWPFFDGLVVRFFLGFHDAMAPWQSAEAPRCWRRWTPQVPTSWTPHFLPLWGAGSGNPSGPGQAPRRQEFPATFQAINLLWSFTVTVCEMENGPVEIVDLPIINGVFP